MTHGQILKLFCWWLERGSTLSWHGSVTNVALFGHWLRPGMHGTKNRILLNLTHHQVKTNMMSYLLPPWAWQAWVSPPRGWTIFTNFSKYLPGFLTGTLENGILKLLCREMISNIFISFLFKYFFLDLIIQQGSRGFAICVGKESFHNIHPVRKVP